MASLKPTHSLYVNNLNEKIKKKELKQSLYHIFSQYGLVLDVVALRTWKMRGQGHVVFADIGAATNAARAMQGFPFFDKPMRVQFARTESELIMRMKGIAKKNPDSRKEKRVAPKDADADGATTKSTKKARTDEERSSEKEMFDESADMDMSQDDESGGPRNKILFIENLPDEVTNEMIATLFQQYAGYVEARMPPNQNVAFVEFDDEVNAATGMESLQGFKLSPTHTLKITYAKK